MHEIIQNQEALYQTGLKAFESGNLALAFDCFDRAIQAQPGHPAYHFALGLVLQRQEKYDEAIERFRQAVRLKPDFAQAYNHLGVLLQVKGDLAAAIGHFRTALNHLPGFAKGWNNLGSVLVAHGDLDEAISAFREAVKLKPDYVLAWNNLGNACQSQAKMDEAEGCFRKAIQLQPDNLFALNSLGHALLVQWKMEEAEQVLRRVAALDTANIQALNNLAYALKEQDKFDEAGAVYKQVLLLNPRNLKAFVGAHLLLSPFYADTAELIAARTQFSEGLKTLLANTEMFRGNNPKSLLAGVRWSNFYLAYQGMDDKELQVEYARFMANILHFAVPDLMQPISVDPAASKRRLRVGFLSSFLRDCTVGRYFKSWITSLDRKKFEVFCYYTGHLQDQVTEEIKMTASCYRHVVGDEEYLGRTVKGDRLDVLIYPELGMDASSFVLAAMRLAPVQCTAWGHPVTTGHANVDYYFSSALMEPEGAESHYSEKLVLLPGMGTNYPKSTLPSVRKRSDFHLPENAPLYLCPQSLYKIHPENDHLFVKILEQDRDAVLVFFQATYDAITHAFIRRLEKVFDAFGLERAGRVKMLPRMGHDDYLRVNMMCDAMLDTLFWSGGNTSLDALVSGLPIVTLPGEFMRGRQSYGMLTLMGLPELIAKDVEDYVAIALRLGGDPVWRQEIRQRISQNIGKIFENQEPVKELERFLLSRFSI